MTTGLTLLADGFSLVAEHVSRKAVVFGGTQSTDTNSTGSSSANGSEPTGAVAALSKTEPVAGDEGLTRLVVLDVLPPGWRPGKSGAYLVIMIMALLV